MAHYKPAGPGTILNFGLANLDSEEPNTLEQIQHQLSSTCCNDKRVGCRVYTNGTSVTLSLPCNKFHSDQVASSNTRNGEINCDGATIRDQKNSGVGVVIRDDNGMVLASMSKQLPQLYSALEVEAMAASTTLSFASQLGFHRVILEFDSLTLATSLRNNNTFLSPDALLMEDIKFHASSFIQLRYSHVKREGN